MSQVARCELLFKSDESVCDFLLNLASAIHARIYLSPQHVQMMSDLLIDALRIRKKFTSNAPPVKDQID